MSENNYVFDSFERENLSYPALLVEDMLMTLMREFGVTTIRYADLLDIANFCMNFIYQKMKQVLTTEYIIEYVADSLPLELVENNYKLIRDIISTMNDENRNATKRAWNFHTIRTLFSMGVIEELQLCECIDRTYAQPQAKGEDYTESENSFFYIKNLTNKTTDGIYRYGLTTFKKGDKFIDEELNIYLQVTHVDSDCKFFRFKLKGVGDNEQNFDINGECPAIGLLVNLLITKYFLKSNSYMIPFNVILTHLETSLDKQLNELRRGEKM